VKAALCEKEEMMRKATFFYCLAIFFLTIGVLFAGTPKRTAILEDSASITSEVLYLTFTEESFGKVGRFNQKWGQVYY